MRIGAHVSTAGGLDKAPARAIAIGAEAMQIFASGPQSWRFTPPSDEQVESFKAQVQASDLGPVFLHAIYLINLAGEDGENLTRSLESLLSYMEVAARIDAAGVIFHVGSHRGGGVDSVLPRIASSMSHLLERAPDKVSLVIENNAHPGHQVGATWAEIGAIIREMGSPRVKVCLDTAHSLAAGYDVRTREGLDSAMEQFEKEIGLKRLAAVHANDSKGALGSGVDRHENIGSGLIGLDGFANILSHPAFADVPFLLEVPGNDNKGPDKPNVDALKAIRQRVLSGRPS